MSSNDEDQSCPPSSGIECAYSFADLYAAGHGLLPDPDTVLKFAALDQRAKNTVVKSWAELANWYTVDRVGTDGVTYTAFAPEKLE